MYPKSVDFARGNAIVFFDCPRTGRLPVLPNSNHGVLEVDLVETLSKIVVFQP